MQERQQPESLRLRSIMPALTVNDIAASVAWYRDVLGCIVAEEYQRDGQLMGVMLKAGAVDILLAQDDFAKGRDRKKGIGMRLYGVTIQEIDKLAEAIVARGGVLAQPPQDQPWGTRDFAIVDPDGFQISISTESPS
jgi:uncharacterized glyoxalase superfamily protein PhnB